MDLIIRLKVFLIVTWIKYQDHLGHDLWRGTVPGSLWGRICDVEQVPWAVAGATDVAVAGPQGLGTLRRQGL